MADADQPTQPPLQPVIWLPYAWADRVLNHMNGFGQIGRFPLEIEHIKSATAALSDVNLIRLRDVRGPQPVKILGRFIRRHITRAGESRPIVEAHIDFEGSLDPKNRRLVICKEICHSFYSDQPITRSVTADQMLALMEGLASINNGSSITPQSPALTAEQQALYTAIEILLPFETREEIIGHHRGDYNRIPVDRYSDSFMIPLNIMQAIFRPGYHDNARISRSFYVGTR
jgi:hypothetical protein